MVKKTVVRKTGRLLSKEEKDAADDKIFKDGGSSFTVERDGKEYKVDPKTGDLVPVMTGPAAQAKLRKPKRQRPAAKKP